MSPLLANIVLNHLDWRLQSEGFQFVRYADDFVVLCRTKDKAEKALALICRVIEQELALRLHPDKTQVVHYLQGFDFLGFHIAHHSCRMRDKAVEKFKDKVRDITTRSHNLGPDAIGKLNRVIRGTVNYFGPPFATGQDLFEKLDRWIRKRIRCMKFKRIRRMDNARLLNKHIAKRGLLSCYDLFNAAQLRSNRSLS